MDKGHIKHIKIKDYDYYDVIVNNKLLVHICRNDVGYNVDLYKHNTDPIDEDYISTCTALDDDWEE